MSSIVKDRYASKLIFLPYCKHTAILIPSLLPRLSSVPTTSEIKDLGIPLSPSFAFLPFPVWNYAASSETQHVLCYVFIVLNLTPYMFTPDTRMVLSFAKIHPCRKIWTPIVIFNHGLLQICWLVIMIRNVLTKCVGIAGRITYAGCVLHVVANYVAEPTLVWYNAFKNSL